MAPRARLPNDVELRVIRSEVEYPVMPVIKLTTSISAPVERVFDLTRSIEGKQQSIGRVGA